MNKITRDIMLSEIKKAHEKKVSQIARQLYSGTISKKYAEGAIKTEEDKKYYAIRAINEMEVED